MAVGAKALDPQSSKDTLAVAGRRVTLYEIDSAIGEMVDALELVVDDSGQVVDEVLEQKIRNRLDTLSMAKEKKAENVAIVIKSMLGTISLLENERISLARRERSLMRKVEWLTRYLSSHLQPDPSKPGLKVSGIRASIFYRRGETIEVRRPDRLPIEFQRVGVSEITNDELVQYGDILRKLSAFSIEPRKDLLKKRIKAGIAKGKSYHRIARLVDSHTLQIK